MLAQLEVDAQSPTLVRTRLDDIGAVPGFNCCGDAGATSDLLDDIREPRRLRKRWNWWRRLVRERLRVRERARVRERLCVHQLQRMQWLQWFDNPLGNLPMLFIPNGIGTTETKGVGQPLQPLHSLQHLLPYLRCCSLLCLARSVPVARKLSRANTVDHPHPALGGVVPHSHVAASLKSARYRSPVPACRRATRRNPVTPLLSSAMSSLAR